MSILEAGIVAHVGLIGADGAPVVLPMAYAVDGEHLLVHGSAASRLMRSRSEVCVTVTVLDGLVLARSLFNSSMNYRSVVVFGVPEVLEGAEKVAALMRLSEARLPGRVGYAREPSDKEVRATTVWRVPLDETSAKVRTGPPPSTSPTTSRWGTGVASSRSGPWRAHRRAMRSVAVVRCPSTWSRSWSAGTERRSPPVSKG